MTALHFSDRLIVLLLALALNATFGGPLSFYRHFAPLNPVRFWDALVRYLESKFNRNWRSAGDLRMRGAILTLLLAGVAWLMGLWLAQAGRMTSYNAVLDVSLLVCMLPLRRLFDEALMVNRSLETNALEKARRDLRESARRNIGQLDAFAIARTTIESLMENFTDRLLSPLFYYLLFGLPGLFVAWSLARIHLLLGSKAPHMAAFGWCAEKCDHALRWLPARLGAIIMTLAASLVPKGNLPRALTSMVRYAPKFVSANSGWPISAAAGALGLTLGGPRSVHLSYFADPWISSGHLNATVLDVRRALYLYALSAGLLCFLLALGSYFMSLQP